MINTLAGWAKATAPARIQANGNTHKTRFMTTFQSLKSCLAGHSRSPPRANVANFANIAKVTKCSSASGLPRLPTAEHAETREPQDYFSFPESGLGRGK